MTKLSEYVKTAEAAQILGVAQNMLRKWSEQGKSRSIAILPTASIVQESRP